MAKPTLSSIHRHIAGMRMVALERALAASSARACRNMATELHQVHAAGGALFEAIKELRAIEANPWQATSAVIEERDRAQRRLEEAMQQFERSHKAYGSAAAPSPGAKNS